MEGMSETKQVSLDGGSIHFDPDVDYDVALAIEGDRIYWDKDMDGLKDAGEPFLTSQGAVEYDTFVRPASDLGFALAFILLAFVMGFTASKLVESYRSEREA